MHSYKHDICISRIATHNILNAQFQEQNFQKKSFRGTAQTPRPWGGDTPRDLRPLAVPSPFPEIMDPPPPLIKCKRSERTTPS